MRPPPLNCYQFVTYEPRQRVDDNEERDRVYDKGVQPHDAKAQIPDESELNPTPPAGQNRVEAVSFLKPGRCRDQGRS
jgi:hypothetical protein